MAKNISRWKDIKARDWTPEQIKELEAEVQKEIENLVALRDTREDGSARTRRAERGTEGPPRDRQENEGDR